jgi:hypothetical protein
VKLGDVRSFADFEREQFRADVPDGSGSERPHFWHAQDYAAALRRWSTAVPAARVHLVVCPPPGAEPDLLWRRFADACGISAAVAGVVDPLAVAPANLSLTTEAVATLRSLNARLAGRITPREHARYVKAGLGEGRLAGRPGTPPRTPASLAEVLVPVADAWRSSIEAGTSPVHGDLDELTPVLGDPRDPHPDDVPRGIPDPVEVAALAAEVLLQVETGRVDSRHDGTGNSGSASAPARAVERLRRRLRLRGR